MTTDEWKAQAEQAMETLCRTSRESGDPFVPDDFLAIVGHPDETHQANSKNNLIGSIFGQYSRAGRMTPVLVARSNQKHRKHGMVRGWIGT